MNWFKLTLLLSKGNKTEFDIPVQVQKTYLDRLGIAGNDVERSFKQYLCQNFFVPKWKVIIQNGVSFCLFFPCLLYLFTRRFFAHKEDETDAISEFKGIEETLPEELCERYNVNHDKWSYRQSLSLRDLWMSVSLFFHYLGNPYFTLKCIQKIAIYSDMIYRYSPNVILVHNEYSFTSSILTFYCKKYGVKHINAMHGDKYFFIRDAFFHYDECYVWDQFYVDLFISLKAEPSQFQILVPPSLKINIKNNLDERYYSDYKYYLDLYTEDEIRGIVQSMEFAKRSGKTIKYRPHPRYSNMDLLKKYVNAEEIESPKDVNILVSISNMEFAIGSCSTVLLQAFFSGKKVVLDDVTYKEQYNKLSELGYILSKKNLPVLSDYQ